MNNLIALRGHIYSDLNPLTYEWSKLGSRFFPKSLVSNSENILRFLALGFRPNIIDVKNILTGLNKVGHKQKGYLLQVTIDPDQHHFLYRTLEPIKTDEGRLQELLRIHDMWVLFFGSAVYLDNPIKKLLESSKYEIEWPAILSEKPSDIDIVEDSSEPQKNSENLKKEQENIKDNVTADKATESAPSKEKIKRDSKNTGSPSNLLASVIR